MNDGKLQARAREIGDRPAFPATYGEYKKQPGGEYKWVVLLPGMTYRQWLIGQRCSARSVNEAMFHDEGLCVVDDVANLLCAMAAAELEREGGGDG